MEKVKRLVAWSGALTLVLVTLGMLTFMAADTCGTYGDRKSVV
jgi:hypothetical protein